MNPEISTFNRYDEIKEYFESMEISEALVESSEYHLDCLLLSTFDVYGCPLFVIKYYKSSGLAYLKFFSSNDCFFLSVRLMTSTGKLLNRNKFKSIFKQYNYNYACNVSKYHVDYEIKFEKDFKLEKLIFINKFFLEYMK